MLYCCLIEMHSMSGTVISYPRFTYVYVTEMVFLEPSLKLSIVLSTLLEKIDSRNAKSIVGGVISWLYGVHSNELGLILNLTDEISGSV